MGLAGRRKKKARVNASSGSKQLLPYELCADQRVRAYDNLCYLVDKYAPWPASKDLGLTKEVGTRAALRVDYEGEVPGCLMEV